MMDGTDVLKGRRARARVQTSGRWGSRSNRAEVTIAAAAALVVGVTATVALSLRGSLTALVLIGVVVPFIAVVLGGLRRILLAAAILDIPLSWDVHLGYRPDVAALGAFGGISLSITSVAVAGLYALWIAELLCRRNSAPRARLRSAVPLLMYLLFSGLSLLVARDAVLGSFELILLVQTFLLFLYISSTVRTAKDVKLIVAMLLLGLALESLVILAVAATGKNFDLLGISTQTGSATGVSRATGTVGSPNMAGGLLALVLGPAAGVLLSSFGRTLRLLAGGAFVAGVLALALTESRGAWVSFAVSMSIVLLVSWRKRWLSPGAVLAVIAGTGIVVVLMGTLVASRLSTNDDGAARSRIPLMQLTETVIEDHPWLGVGENNFPLVIPDYAGPEYTGDFLYSTHNKYLLVWAEGGIGALVGLVWFLVATVRRGWQVVLGDDPLLAPLALGFAAAVTGHLVHMGVDVFRDRPAVQLLWVSGGLLVAIHALAAAAPVRSSRRRAMVAPAYPAGSR
jgi:O-antigen ligase